jgi:hypothetical protein
LFAAIALVGFGAFASGCDDDGGGNLTLEEYFERVDELDNEQQSKSDELERELDDLGDDASPDDAADSFEKQIELLEQFRSDLDDINPPAEVEDAHERVVTSLAAASDQFDGVIEEFRNADSIEDAFASLDDADFSEIEKANEACRELEQIAADNNIEVDFDCDND